MPGTEKPFSLDDILKEHPPQKGGISPDSNKPHYQVSEHTFDLERLLNSTQRVMSVAPPPDASPNLKHYKPTPNNADPSAPYDTQKFASVNKPDTAYPQKAQKKFEDTLHSNTDFNNSPDSLFQTIEQIHASIPDQAPTSKKELKRLRKLEKKRLREEARVLKSLKREMHQDIFSEDEPADSPIQNENELPANEPFDEPDLYQQQQNQPQQLSGSDYLDTFNRLSVIKEEHQNQPHNDNQQVNPIENAEAYGGFIDPALSRAFPTTPRKSHNTNHGAASFKNRFSAAALSNQEPLSENQIPENTQELSNNKKHQRHADAAAQLPSPERLRAGTPPPPLNRQNDSEQLSFEGKNVRAISQNNRISGNTEILESLMRIKKERIARTSAIQAISRKSIQDVNLNLDGKIIPDTSQIPHVQHYSDEHEKMLALEERRRKKVSEFVLDSEDDPQDYVETADDGDIDDFENFDDAPSIYSDIQQLKGSLVVRLIVLLFMGLFSLYLTLSSDFAIPIPELLSRTSNPTNFLFVQTILGLLSVFVSYTVISCGIAKLFRFRGDCDSISAISIISSLIATAVCIASPDLVRRGVCNVFITASIFCLIFNTVGKLLIVGRTSRNFQYVSGDFERYGIFIVENDDRAAQFTKGTLTDFPYLAAMRKSEFISDFLRNSYASDLSDKFCRVVSPLICAAGVCVGALAGILSNSSDPMEAVYIGLSVFSGAIALTSLFGIMLVVNLPLFRTAKHNTGTGAAALSYQSVEEFADVNSVLLDASSLFPPGMINLASIKTFSDTRIDEAIVQAASLTNHAGSILKNMFYDIIVGKTEMLSPVESYIFEDSMGLCGWIDNKRILLGNRELMVNHSIEGMPTPAREAEYTENGKVAIYLSISGELSAMFVIEIKASLEVQRWLRELEKANISIMLRSVDAIITVERLTELFFVSPELLKLLPFRMHPAFEAETSYQQRISTSMVCSGRLASFTSLLLSARHLRSVATLGLTIQGASLILGLILAIILASLSSFSQLTGSMVVAYNVAFLLITVIIQSFRKV